MVKLNSMLELLIDENKALRDHITSKNKDMEKLLKTIGLRDSEAVTDLRDKLRLFGEENNILLG